MIINGAGNDIITSQNKANKAGVIEVKTRMNKGLELTD